MIRMRSDNLKEVQQERLPIRQLACCPSQSRCKYGIFVFCRQLSTLSST
jgi:hypothetical protein